jgi:hypothetical protein
MSAKQEYIDRITATMQGVAMLYRQTVTVTITSRKG